ncbi:MAG: HEAT repeat domain-containing protein, partial [bacterium]
LGANITKKSSTLAVRETGELAKLAVNKAKGTFKEAKTIPVKMQPPAVSSKRNHEKVREPELRDAQIERITGKVQEYRDEIEGLEKKIETVRHRLKERQMKEEKKKQEGMAQCAGEEQKKREEAAPQEEMRRTAEDQDQEPVRAKETRKREEKVEKAHIRTEPPEEKVDMSHLDRILLENAVRDMNDADPDIRKAAARELARLGKIAIPCLLNRALEDEDQNVRAAAVTSLGKIRDEKVTVALKQALEDPSPRIRTAALRGLYKIADLSSTECLLKALVDPSAEVRRRAAVYSGWRQAKEAIPRLAIMLRSEDERIKEEAAAALGNMGDTRAVQYLIPALSDSSAEVRKKAAEALNRLTHRKAAFPADGDEDERKEHVGEWEKWWRMNRETMEI